MSERSVAEIVWGITSRPCSNRRDGGPGAAECERIGCTEWVDAEGRTEYSLSDFGEPTADDLLAWLTTHDRFMALTAVKGKPVMVEVVVGNTTRFWSVVRDPTLLAALEAAVRAVAEAI